MRVKALESGEAFQALKKKHQDLAERFARKYKRKAHQMMSFRGTDSDTDYCNGLSTIETMRMNGENILEASSKDLQRPRNKSHEKRIKTGILLTLDPLFAVPSYRPGREQ